MNPLQLGSCFSFSISWGNYIGGIITDIYTNEEGEYVGITLLNYYEKTPPTIEDFKRGKVFGTRYGCEEEYEWAVDIQMILKEIFISMQEKNYIGILQLNENKISISSYFYISSIEELEMYFKEEINIRILKTENANKYPALSFVIGHLIDLKHFQNN